MDDSDLESEYEFEYEDDSDISDTNRDDGSQDNVLASIANYDNVRQKLYNYELYTLLSLFQDHLIPKARNLALVLSLSLNQALFLLIDFKWNSEKLMESYTEKYGKLLEERGIASYNYKDNAAAPNGKLLTQNDFMCDICADEGSLETFLLHCRHSYCLLCYQQYVDAEITKGGVIRCPDPECNAVLLFEDLKTLYKETYHTLCQLVIELNVDTLIKQKSQKFHNVSFGAFVGDSSDLEEEDEEEKMEREKQRAELMADPEISVERLENMFIRNDDDDERVRSMMKELITPKCYSKQFAYERTISEKYADMHKDIRWCPAPDCRSILRLIDYIPSKEELKTKILRLPVVSCLQNHNFCLNCNLENHYPVPCHVAEAWVVKCTNDSETANWINLNTRVCPKCNYAIEKNGGCNHMTCRQCQYEFCWICQGKWSLHGNQYYQCNRYKDDEAVKTKKDIDSKRQKHTKYIHYFDRYQIHQVSINKDYKIYEQISEKIKSVQEKEGISWIDCQFLRNAIQVLVKARSTLQWSYVFLYYLSDNSSNSALLFEENQTSLSNAVEDLSLLFSKSRNYVKQRVEFIEAARFCVSRQLSLISCAEEGLLAGRLTLDTTIGVDTFSQVNAKRK